MTNYKTKSPTNINAIEWAQANDRARHVCARVFRDGGSPADALKSHGVTETCDANDWGKAVELVAQALCSSPPMQRAA